MTFAPLNVFEELISRLGFSACFVLFVHFSFFCCTTAWILDINVTHDLKLVFVSRDFNGFSG